MNIEQFKIDQKIDPGALDVEALHQAELFSKYALDSVDARAAFDVAKASLDTVEARLSLDCRANPSDFGLEKATEGAINQAVTCHEQYITSRDKMLRAKSESAAADAMRDSIGDKKYMLQLLVQLYAGQYFAGPSLPRNLVERVASRDAGIAAAATDAQRAKVRRPRKSGE